jgi:hypothetical protein
MFSAKGRVQVEKIDLNIFNLNPEKEDGAPKE